MKLNVINPGARRRGVAATLLAVAWILLAPGPLRAGPPARYSVANWGPEQGLRSSAVISLLQSADGYLWLGTVKGLIRFDGVHFTPFQSEDAPWLNNSTVVRLFEDRRQRLWIGTAGDGVAVVREGLVTRLDLGPAARTREGRLAAAGEAADGAVWLATADGLLVRHAEETTREILARRGGEGKFPEVMSTPDGELWVCRGLDLSTVRPGASAAADDLQPRLTLPEGRRPDYLLPCAAGGFWLIAGPNVWRLGTNGEARVFAACPWRPYPNQVTCACEDRDGHLVVGTSQEGVFWFDGVGTHRQFSTARDLPLNYILALCVDREGSLWIGMDGGGVSRITAQTFHVLEALGSKTVQSVCEDPAGGLWLGIFGGGVYHYQNEVLAQVGLRQGELERHLNVAAVQVDPGGIPWVAIQSRPGHGLLLQAREGGIWRVPGFGEIGEISGLFTDHTGRLWVATRQGLGLWFQGNWELYTTRQGLSADDVRALAEDAAGGLWVGTRGGGLNYFKDGKFTAYHRQEPDGLPGEDITSLCRDADGVLWAGTPGQGLARYAGGKWSRCTTREGLASNNLGYLLDDPQGNLWLGSDLGLLRVPRKALADLAEHRTNAVPCSVYGKADGLPTPECTQDSQPGPCRTRDGTLWFPTTKGLAGVNPADLRPNTNPPPVVIESVLIDDVEQQAHGMLGRLPAVITVPSGQERLDIRYTGLSLAAPERARFKYRLENQQSAWTDGGNARPGAAHYTQLRPGRYRFHVIAGNEAGVWNEAGATVAIVVEPPYWQTLWFLVPASLLLFGLVAGGVHYFSTQRLQRQLAGLRQQQALERERRRISRDIHDQLGASLTQVALLGELVESDKEDPAEVAEHARQIALTARDTSRALDEIVWAVNPTNDTLDGLVNYFCKYAQEYLTIAGLRYRLEVPDHLPATPVPPDLRHNVFLAAKEAVTNIVRHARAGNVWLRLRLESGRFTLEIEDDGAGMAQMDEKRARSRNGLSNMRKRLEEVGGACTFTPREGGGTIVRLVAPLGAAAVARPEIVPDNPPPPR